MKKIWLFSFLFIAVMPGFPQIGQDYYFIEFTDKENTPFSIDQPLDYLSQKAVDRRDKYGIAVTIQDFPPNPQYVQVVDDIGVKIIEQTRWLNGIVIKTADTDKLNQVMQLPFVKKIVKNKQGRKRADEAVIPFKNDKFLKPTGEGESYGEMFSQIAMLKGTELHTAGFWGEGMTIAVLDGGFTSANFMDAFDSLRANGQIKGTINLVGGGTYVYQGTMHGSYVLSTMAANIPGVVVGSAPKADYYLIRSEDTNGEWLLEEYNWVRGAEYADSVGADIITSSLDYLLSSNPDTELDYSQLDGNTAPATIAADAAAAKGMLVVVSAGNNGELQEWPYVGFPADADSVLTIGSTDAHGIRSSFSSTGMTFDGRLKPDVTTRGEGVIVATGDNSLGSGNGTSFSTPVIAGLAACLWQADINLKNTDIMQLIHESSSSYANPDSLLGYGVPDFSTALEMINSSKGHNNHFTFQYENNKITLASSQVTDEEVSLVIKTKNKRIMVFERNSIRFNEKGISILDGFNAEKGVEYLISIKQGRQIPTEISFIIQ